MEIDNSSSVKMEQVQQEDERSSIEQVELTVPKTVDPTLPVLTFRTWVLGSVSCVLLSFVNQFFWYRTQPFTVTSMSAQIAVVPIGHFMARVLPTRRFLQGTRFEFTMNPGSFNVKEHVLITIFANCGGGTVYATHILTAVKIYYKRKLTFLPAFIVMLTTQVLGFGWAGIFRKYLVEPEKMWWPLILVQVSLFSALHERSKRPKGCMTRTQFFLLVMIASFAYYIFPGYLFIMLTSVSWVCWIRPNSILVNQLGSGMKGLGIGSFGIEWSAIAAYLSTPLASPWFATANIAVGFFSLMYVMTPITYWFNIYSAKTFPIFSSNLFMANGSRYEVLDIIDSRFQLDHGEYAKKGPVHMSTFFAFTYGLGFATLSATVMHVLLFNARDILDSFRGNKKKDVHARLMKSYKSVPTLWFILILVINIALILFACVYYKESLQLPWWGALLACFMAVVFTYPIGVIQATTNQQPGLNIITEYVIGYLYPERPVANMCFKVYGYISMMQGLNFVSDFKLGHYMKIPPRAMFTAQTVGTVVAVVVYQCTAWWLMADIPNLCDTSLLPPDSPWTCPQDRVFFDASVIWGLVGPRRIFGNLGEYSNINWFFLGGAIAPVLVWLAHRIFPKQKWILAVNMPVLLGATAMMPPATALNFTSWIFVAFLSGFVVFRYRQDLWKKYNYVASGALEAGTAFVTILVFITLQSQNIELDWWGNKGELCPLATCPTAKGVVIAGCPVL